MTNELKQIDKQDIIVYDGDVKLTMNDMRKQFCPLATDQELYIAFGIAKTLNLNPFKREIHFIKYSAAQKLQTVVGYDVYIKRAERTGKLDGWKVEIDDECISAKITIFRKDFKYPFEWTVYADEFDKKQANWQTMPRFMLRKVTIGQGFRLAFPDELGGMPYLPEEHEAFGIGAEKPAGKPAVNMPVSKSSPNKPIEATKPSGQDNHTSQEPKAPAIKPGHTTIAQPEQPGEPEVKELPEKGSEQEKPKHYIIEVNQALVAKDIAPNTSIIGQFMKFRKIEKKEKTSYCYTIGDMSTNDTIELWSFALSDCKISDIVLCDNCKITKKGDKIFYSCDIIKGKV